MADAHPALAVDQEARRHRLDVELTGDRPFGVVLDAEFRGDLLEEGIGERAVLVEVDGDDDEALFRVLLLELVHPRERLKAGRAPGRPEIDQDDLAVQGLEQGPVGRGRGRQGVRIGSRSGRAATGGRHGNQQDGNGEQSRAQAEPPSMARKLLLTHPDTRINRLDKGDAPL